ncbi:MAG: hypothetical protein JNJ88_19615 [Planctomycetes bacterium]|nr:hypothetical protein [Planctomycetota bacterium]
MNKILLGGGLTALSAALGLVVWFATAQENGTEKKAPIAVAKPASAPAEKAAAAAPAPLAAEEPLPKGCPPGSVRIEGPNPDWKYYKTPDNQLFIDGVTRTIREKDGTMRTVVGTIMARPKVMQFDPEKSNRGKRVQPNNAPKEGPPAPESEKPSDASSTSPLQPPKN